MFNNWYSDVNLLLLQILVLISASSLLNNVPPYLKEQYKNLFFVRVNMTSLVDGTPASKLWSTKAITDGYYLNNISNVLRIVILLRFGGIYFDSDVISVKSVPTNYEVIQSVLSHSTRLYQVFESRKG